MAMDGNTLNAPLVGQHDRPSGPSKVAQRLQAVLQNIHQTCQAVGRDPGSVRLVVVTKSATLEQIREVVDLGYLDLGENHVQQLRRLWCQIAEFWDAGRPGGIGDRIRWHMIGHLQRNKVRYLLPKVTLIHSVDTLRLAECINNEAARLGVRAKVLLQVNTSNEPQKYGVPVGAATHLAEQLQTLPNLELTGLMTMAPLTLNKEVIHACFARAQELFEEIRGEKIVGPGFTELSMGMSSDYTIAIEHGATILRIGSAIFTG